MNKYFGLGLVGLMGCLSAHSQVSSANMVGYAKLPFHPGKHLLANSFHRDAPHNLLSEWLYAAPTGTVVSVWDSELNAFGEYMILGEYGWSDDFPFPIGSTALVETPAFFQVIWSGEVHDGDGESLGPMWDDEFRKPTPFEALAGTYLKGTILPIPTEENTERSGVFQWVLGRDARIGVSVTTIDGESQITTTTTYLGDGAWDNGVPELGVGEAAYFTFPKNSTYGRVPDLSLNPTTNQVVVATEGGTEEIGNPLRIDMDGLYEGVEYRLLYTEILTNDWQVGCTFEAMGSTTNILDLSFCEASSSNGFYKLEFVE